MQSLIHTDNLCIGYNQSKNLVASNINIELQQGELIGLVGQNGIGKSTLLKTLIGIQKPLNGKVFLNNKEVSSYTTQQISQNISIVLTEKISPSNLTIYELIALGRQPYTNWLGTMQESDKVIINNAISLTQVEDLLHKKHFEISDGQLQKVLIARALAQDTPIIVLDEPTTHLDLQHKVMLFKLLKKLAVETKKCILYSTHDIDLAIQLSNKLIVMTHNNVLIDQPCNLISKGVFNSLFTSKDIAFDSQKGKFVIL